MSKPMSHAPVREQAIKFGDLQDHLGYVLRRAQMEVFSRFAEAMREVDLTPGQFGVLVLIDQNPGVRQSAICDALGIQRSNFVALLHDLERRGLALRRTHGSDARINALHLTRKGQALLRRANTLHTAYEAQLTQRLGPAGRETLLTLLRELSGSPTSKAHNLQLQHD
jgi:DNA-binding MarR family transcriptional regulator